MRGKKYNHLPLILWGEPLIFLGNLSLFSSFDALSFPNQQQTKLRYFNPERCVIEG